MGYIVVLWIELSPAFLEKFAATAKIAWLRHVASRPLPVVDKALICIIALGILLPTMHQSSLGTLMLLAGPRLHPLWNTPLLPLLFLMSVHRDGLRGRRVRVGVLGDGLQRRPGSADAGQPLQGDRAVALLAFVVLRFADLAWRGQLGLLVRRRPLRRDVLDRVVLFLRRRS